ncbi:hypothetical protein MICRO8M_20023 [Microbacterium sp. 8M]|nr:hypothetical protein MICRO8M_20023 [Microbacterium sp. 8M]
MPRRRGRGTRLSPQCDPRRRVRRRRAPEADPNSANDVVPFGSWRDHIFIRNLDSGL